MLFGGWGEEEEETVKNHYNGDWNAYKQDQLKQQEESLNNFKYPLKAKFKGIELQEGDLITNSATEGDIFIIVDFERNGRPLCQLFTNKAGYDRIVCYPHEEIFVIKSTLDI